MHCDHRPLVKSMFDNTMQLGGFPRMSEYTLHQIVVYQTSQRVKGWLRTWETRW